MKPDELDQRAREAPREGHDARTNATPLALPDQGVWDSSSLSTAGAQRTSVCPHCEARYGPELRFCPVDGATLRPLDDDTSIVGRIVADRYQVLEKLGEGGMGQVYLAEHVRMGRRCALKVINPRLVSDTGAIARFDREASSASRIAHPNVAAVYDFGEASDGVVYLAMEYVAGESLKAILARDGPLSPRRAVRIAEQIADGLTAAHELGIVHRDLKPDNIMIGTNRDGTDCVKVVDFGIAKVLHHESERLTSTGLAVGTPLYMSPEQLAADPVDERSDVYSLGLLIFEMLTGTLPFPTTRDATFARLVQPPRTLADTRPDVAWPSPLERVLARALSREKEERYTSAEDVKHDVRQVVDAHWPELAAPGQGRRDARSQPRVPGRRRSRTALAALFGAAVIISIAWLAVGGIERDPVPAQSAESGGTVGEPVEPPGETAAPPAGLRIVERSPQRSPRGREVAPSSAAGVVAPDAVDATAKLRQLETWTNASTGDAASARRALAELPDLLPRLTSADDTVAAYYHAANAHLLLDQPREACHLLLRIEEQAQRHRYLARAVAAYLAEGSPLGCSD